VKGHMLSVHEHLDPATAFLRPIRGKVGRNGTLLVRSDSGNQLRPHITSSWNCFRQESSPLDSLDLLNRPFESTVWPLSLSGTVGRKSFHDNATPAASRIN